MQKILDRTQASLTEAFAALAKNARRQQALYLTAMITLMAIVLVSALLLVWLAASKQLDYRRNLANQYAADISLLLHGEMSFLRRTELTVAYYQHSGDLRSLPPGVEDSIRQSGMALCTADATGAHFDLLVPEATRQAWGPALGAKLLALYAAGQSTLVTQQAFELGHRAMLIGLTDDYAAIVPAVEANAQGNVAPLQARDATRLRAFLLREVEAQTGQRVPAKNQRLWIGPYTDPLLHAPVMTLLSAYYDGDTPTTLVSTSIPVDALLSRFSRRSRPGVLLLMTADRRAVVSSTALDSETGRMLQASAAQMQDDTYRYTREGVILRESVAPGFASLVGFLSWHALIVVLGWQLWAIVCAAIFLLAGIALTTRFWGLRLLRLTHDQTARALENEAINHVLVSATPIGLCIVRRSDYSILTANETAVELLHVEPLASRLPAHIAAALRGQFDAGPGATPDAARISVFTVAALPEHSGKADTGFLQFNCAPARHGGEAVLFCAILDVTAQRTLEAQLRAAQRATETTMRERSNFFASMSHEIRTPLNALLGNLELFSRTPGLDAHEQRLRALGVAADALRRIVNDILDFSKIDAGEMKIVTESFRPIDDFENLALSYAPMPGSRPIRFYAHLSPTLDQTLCGDRTRIAQIVNNLLSNAFKFTSFGKITLGAEVVIDTQGRSILTCRVCDSGIGMDPLLVSRIFHPFVQAEVSTSSRYGGTGLGLSICASLCELMGGHISVESVQGVGSAFTVSIPLTLPPEAERAPLVVPTRRGNVLVLCQDSVSGQIVGGCLGRDGWLSHSVTSIAAAEEWLRGNRPDVLVVTGEYGLDVIAALRAVRPVNAVWITRTGLDRPTPRGDGVLEVSEFSHVAILSAADRAASQMHDRPDLAADAAAVAVAAPHERAAVSPSPAAAPASSASSAELALQGLAILVAEDNPLNQTLILEQLQALGCEPILAGDGRQALAALEENEVDVVLTDIHMPVMGGYELLATLRERHPGLPVLAFSAVTDTQQAAEWRERGFAGYIPKPTSLKELEAALGALSTIEDKPAAEPQRTPDFADSLDAQTRARYVAMLKEHLAADLPRLSAIIEACDRLALRDWAHSAAGGFLIVGEPRFAAQCRELQNYCQQQSEWSEQMAGFAIALHDGLRDHYGLFQPNPQDS